MEPFKNLMKINLLLQIKIQVGKHNMVEAKPHDFDGAKEAILDIISDSSLQAGANFGFGHWNGGEGDHANKDQRKIRPYEGYCHKHQSKNSCYYYREDNGPSPGPQETGVAWKGEHPEGTSGMCTKHSCLNVAVHKNGYREIPDVLADLEMAYATDTDAFADLAYGYFTNLDGKTPVINDRRPCQQHYVIVISDGRMYNEDRSIPNIKELRREYKVRTLFVAYGGAYEDVVAKKYLIDLQKLARVMLMDQQNAWEQ